MAPERGLMIPHALVLRESEREIQIEQITKSDQIKVISWNVSSVKKDTYSILQQTQGHIYCLQETRKFIFNSNKTFTFYNRTREEQNGGGIAVAISNQFTSRDITNQFQIFIDLNLEFQAIHLVNQMYDAILFNFYFPQKLIFVQYKDKINQEFIRIFQQQPIHRKIIICGDFNYKSCPINNVSYFPQKEIKTFRRIVSGKIRESRTDHIMLYPPTEQVDQLTVQNSSSDHKIIQVSIKIKLLSKKNDITLFNKQNAFLLCKKACKISKSFEEFYKYVKQRLIKYNVISKHRIRIYQQNQYEKSITEHLQSIDQNFKENQTGIGFKKIKGVTILNPDKRDGSIFNAYLDNSGEILFNSETEICLDKLSGISGWRLNQQQVLPNLPPLNIEDIKKIQLLMSQNKAICYDGISDLWLRKNKNYDLLLNLWNNQTQILNPSLFRARLIPLNKAHPNIPSEQEFRPIVVLSPLLKFMELRFVNKLNKYMSDKMSMDQQGFVKQSGTFICQLRIQEILLKETKQGHSSNKCCLFLDYKSAYNYVDRSKIYQIMREKEILNEDEIQFLQICQESQYFKKLDGTKISLINGVPQGSPLSPALFNIYMEDYIREFRGRIKQEIQCIIYADDLAIIFNSQYILGIMQALEELEPLYKMKINKQKSGFFLFKDYQNNNQLNGFPVLTEYKYLGILIDKFGTLTPHIELIQKRINFIQKKISWISSQLVFKNKLLLWKLYVLPHFLYQIPSLLMSASNKQIEELQQLWRNSLRKCLGLPKCCPNIILAQLTGTLNDWVKRMSKQIMMKVKKRIQSPSAVDKIVSIITERITEKSTYGFSKLKNLPDNFNKLFYKQSLLCQQHLRHLNDTHLIKYHMMTGVEEFYKVVLARKKNEVSKQKIEKFIETIKNIPIAKEQDKDKTSECKVVMIQKI
ncbi:hypothetical protein pb186bvf_005099 [Paramecium bursaria]